MALDSSGVFVRAKFSEKYKRAAIQHFPLKKAREN